jgi:hypothetical protein
VRVRVKVRVLDRTGKGVTEKEKRWLREKKR